MLSYLGGGSHYISQAEGLDPRIEARDTHIINVSAHITIKKRHKRNIALKYENIFVSRPRLRSVDLSAGNW